MLVSSSTPSTNFGRVIAVPRNSASELRSCSFVVADVRIALWEHLWVGMAVHRNYLILQMNCLSSADTLSASAFFARDWDVRYVRQ
jgi:hypothetical protein